MAAKRPAKLMIGWRETASLPEWGLTGVKVKSDTGARTTALHASDIVEERREDRLYVSFALDHPAVSHDGRIVLPVLHKRAITNTSGIPDIRYIITARLQIGDRVGRVEMSLAERGAMQFPIILGRTSMRVLRLTVDPTRSWLQSEKPAKDRG